jgi:tetratricopeptide (TPR) repeat protein
MNSGKGITKAEAFENMQALLRGRTRVIGGSVGDIESRGGVTDVSETETSAEESYEVSSEESSKESSEESSEESSSDESSSSSSSSSSSETAFPETAKPVRVRLEVDEKKGYVTVGIVLNDESTTSVEASEKVGDGSSDGDDDVANVDEVERIPDDSSIASEADSPTSSSDLNDTTPRGLLKEGLAKLRVARHSANEADGVPQSMLVADNEMNDAIDLLSAAADGFEELVEGETDLTLGDDSSSLCAAARGNLGNALLSRGRLQLRLSKLAYAQERNARANGVRAGADGAAQFHEETAEECFVLAGRAFKASLNLSGGPGNGSGSSRALCGWGSALALRGQMAYQTSALVSAAALACAACEKYRSALELDADDTGVQSVESVNTSTGGYVTTREATSSFTVQSKAAAFLDWGDALQLAAKASSKALTESRRNGFNTGADAENGYVQLVANLPSPGECWSKAELCYEQAARWDTQPGGEISDAAARGARACRDATR